MSNSHSPIPFPTPVPTPAASRAGSHASGRILVNTERLRSFASQVQGIATELESISAWPVNAMEKVELEIKQCLALTGEAMGAAKLAKRLSEHATEMAQYLSNAAQRFEQADAQGVQDVGALHQQWTNLEQAADEGFEKWLDTRIDGDRDNIGGRTSNQCVGWAVQRRQSLGGNKMPAIGLYDFSQDSEPLGAKHLAQIYGDAARSWEEIQRLLEHAPYTLDRYIEPGSAIVWDATSGNSAGHVAVVEVVTTTGIWISESNVPFGSGPRVRFITIEDLDGTAVIPPGAKEPDRQQVTQNN